MRRTSQAYRLLMGETIAIDDVDHTIVSVPRNSGWRVCDFCEYQGECPYEVREVCKLLIPTEITDFTLARSTRRNNITL